MADCKNLQLQSSRHQQTGQAQDRQKSGRPRVTTPAEDRYIRTIHLRNRFVTVTTLGHPISRRTVLRRLRRDGIKAFQGMALNLLYRQRRLQWARTDSSGVIRKGCFSQLKVASTCSEMMAEFMFIVVGESDWRRTASKMCTLLVKVASWYGAVFVINGEQGISSLCNESI